VDTSAIAAIWFGEPGAEDLRRAIACDPNPKMSAATLVELHVVLDRRDRPAARREADALIEALGISIEPFTPRQALLAASAHRDYGRGSGHSARLNLGDCFSYALAATSREPLAFVGDDFSHTEVVPAVPSAAKK
jgi:ribonuclease VapC